MGLDLDVVSKESSARSAAIAVTATAGQRFPPDQGPRPSHPGRPQIRRGRDPKPAGWEQEVEKPPSSNQIWSGINGATHRTTTSNHHLPAAPATEETGHQHRRTSPASGSTPPSPREAAAPVARALRSRAAKQ
jgi:hypothetical protein